LKSYKIELSREAAAFLAEIAYYHGSLYRRIANAIESLKTNPYQGKLLKAKLKGRYSRRVGAYRIVYKIEADKLIIFVIDINHRRDVYR